MKNKINFLEQLATSRYWQIAVAFSAVFAFVLLSDTVCIFRGYLGIPCPGCGMTRAWLAVFDGDIPRAFFFHPLFWLVPLATFVWILRNKNTFCQKLLQSRLVFSLTVGAVLLVYLARMVLYFPHEVPMDYNHGAILPTIYRLIFG